MKLKTKNPYKAFDQYCLRTPIYPLNFYTTLTNNSYISEQDFKNLFENAVFIEALYLASPELYSQFKKWFDGKIEDPKKISRLKLSVLKYFTRMTTRCTPFGLFAGCSVGTFSDTTSISLNEINYFKRKTRLDMSFLSFVIDNIAKKEAVKNTMRFFSNNSLYMVGNQYRYVVYDYIKERRDYSLDGVICSDFLGKIFREAQKGKTINELALSIIDKDISKDDALAFINELIKNQLLVSELQLTLTGENDLDQIIKQLGINSQTRSVNLSLINLNKKLKDLDSKLENSIEKYHVINDTVNILDISKDYKKHLLQVDTFTSFAANNLDRNNIAQIKKAMTLLNKMTLPYANERIEDFKRQFKKRYETKELALVEVLDTEIGIDYDTKKEDNNPLIDDIYLPEVSRKYQHLIWTVIDSILLEKVNECAKQGRHVIQLYDKDFEDLNPNWDDLPDTMSSVIELTSINSIQKIVFESVGGSTAANLLARFSHGDESMLKHVQNIMDVESNMNSDKILAEIIHLPQARTGNILKRSALRAYEIPYLGKSSLSLDKQIPIGDIMISIRNNKIYLRSKKYNKEILPRLTNAHNYKNTPLPIYYFLCDVQTQHMRSGVGFRWNSILKDLPFLPRVEFNTIIFAKARWNIKTSSLNDFYHLKSTMLINTIKRWRKSIQLPLFVQLMDRDNTLLINMNNETSIQMLLETVKNKASFILEEFLFNTESPVKKGMDAFCNQFVVSFYNEEKLKSSVNA